MTLRSDVIVAWLGFMTSGMRERERERERGADVFDEIGVV